MICEQCLWTVKFVELEALQSGFLHLLLGTISKISTVFLALIIRQVLSKPSILYMVAIFPLFILWKIQPIKFDFQGKLVIVSPYKKGREGNDTNPAWLDDMKKDHWQVNYKNIILN